MQAPPSPYELRTRAPSNCLGHCRRHESHHNNTAWTNTAKKKGKMKKSPSCALSHAAVRRPNCIRLRNGLSDTQVCLSLRGSTDSLRGDRAGRAHASAVYPSFQRWEQLALFQHETVRLNLTRVYIWRRFFDFFWCIWLVGWRRSVLGSTSFACRSVHQFSVASNTLTRTGDHPSISVQRTGGEGVLFLLVFECNEVVDLCYGVPTKMLPITKKRETRKKWWQECIPGCLGAV